VSNQNQDLTNKFGLKIGIMLSLAMVFCPLKAKAQVYFPILNNKQSSYTSSVESKLTKSKQAERLCEKEISIKEQTSTFCLLRQSFQNEVSSTVQKEQEENKLEEEPLDFSSSGRSGQQTAGESRGSCPQMNFPLTAIAPKSNVSQTLATHPRWWFFVPYKTSQIKKVEFVVQDEERNDVLRDTIYVPETVPYFSTTIPSTDPGLKSNRWYRWYLKVYCLEGEETVPLFVSGWVQKIIVDGKSNNLNSLTLQNSLTVVNYAQKGLWLDAIDLLMKTQVSDASASHLSQIWQKIINSPEINLELPFPAAASIVIK
jgi:hypothetical protein